jgi:two-component system OmpR family response regulator/two-component system alkaline phosphatase synthesis response regulator PhoP
MCERGLNTLAPKSILLVDDDESVATSLSLLLTMDGHRVEVVSDGETALAKYVEGKFDLVITDFFMPRMNGLVLARLIKAHVPQQPIILFTGHLEAVSDDEKTGLEHVEAVLPKPFSQAQLQRAFRAVFPHG